MPQAMFMMHSFSFIDKASLKEDEPGTEQALYRSPPLRSRFIEIYGSKPELRDRFEQFAEKIAGDDRVEVKTLASAADGLQQRATEPYPDIVPLV